MGTLGRVDRLLAKAFPRYGLRTSQVLAATAEIQRLQREIDRLKPGHYYSPIPSLDEVRARAPRIFDRSLRELPGIDLNVERQLATLEKVRELFPEQPFPQQPQPGRRFYFRNGAYGPGDAIFLYTMMRLARPRRIIEIGSGHSSHLMLDVNDLFFDGRIKLTFIEPYDERLRSGLREDDYEAVEIVTQPVQDVR